MNRAIRDWESDKPNPDFRIPSPRDYAPEDYPTPESEGMGNDNQDDTQNDDDAKNDNEDDGKGDAKDANEDIPIDRKPDLAFPDKAPPSARTHLHGYWAPKTTSGKTMEVWCDYQPHIHFAQLPNNFKWVDDHWTGRKFPGGKMAFAGTCLLYTSDAADE